MAWHTFKEAVKLTGRSRRSIYRDMAAGRISTDMDRDGQRRFETSELIRVYGPLLPVTQPMSPEMAQSVTPTELTAVLAELQALRSEVQELRTSLLRIEHKPDTTPTRTTRTTTREPTSWSSLLDALDE
jgi:predicted DNA-binding transcriptional regulator YafY